MHRNLQFKLMALNFRFRDLFLPPGEVLKEAGIEPGFYLLDYGCGPGSYSLAAAHIVGETGKVYALDVNPFAIQYVRKKASKNIETILSDCKIGLKDCSIDCVLLYDTFHLLTNPDAVLEELHRVMRPGSILSFSDHHMKEDEIIEGMTRRGLFRWLKKGKRTYTFSKER